MCKSCRTGSFRANNNTAFLSILNSLRFLTRIFPVNWELILISRQGGLCYDIVKNVRIASDYQTSIGICSTHRDFPTNMGPAISSKALVNTYLRYALSWGRTTLSETLKYVSSFDFFVLREIEEWARRQHTQKGPWLKHKSDLWLIVSRKEM
jgi:hypothetical protein